MHLAIQDFRGYVISGRWVGEVSQTRYANARIGKYAWFLPLVGEAWSANMGAGCQSISFGGVLLFQIIRWSITVPDHSVEYYCSRSFGGVLLFQIIRRSITVPDHSVKYYCSRSFGGVLLFQET